MASRRAIRQRWFSVSADALARATGGAVVGVYRCPCCLKDLAADALNRNELTDEDVPPKALGGKPLTLTCRTCNNTAGQLLDAQADRREGQIRLVEGAALLKPLRVIVHVAGVKLRANLHGSRDSGILIEGVPPANPPEMTDTFGNILEAPSGQGPEVRLELEEVWHRWRATLSWVRAAYLAAFAALGYRYILDRPELDLLRNQFQHPDKRTVPETSLMTKPGTQEAFELLLVETPEEFSNALLVQVARRMVLLPGLEGEASFFDRAHQTLKAHGVREGGMISIQFSGKSVPWPSNGPRHDLDLL